MLPRVIHRIWLGGEEPDWLKAFASTWSQAGWETWQWTDANVSRLFPLVNQSLYDRAEEIAPNHVGQLRGDVLRYELLHRFGGVYVDADFEGLRPLDRLVAGVGCFAAWVTPMKWVNNAVMGSIPGHPFIGRLIDGLEKNVRRHAGARPAKLTGPQYLTEVYLRHPDITVFPRELFYPFSWEHADRFTPGDFDPAERWPDAYAVHWWANQRRERGLACAA